MHIYLPSVAFSAFIITPIRHMMLFEGLLFFRDSAICGATIKDRLAYLIVAQQQS
jgi:hypothetical protein